MKLSKTRQPLLLRIYDPADDFHKRACVGGAHIGIDRDKYPPRFVDKEHLIIVSRYKYIIGIFHHKRESVMLFAVNRDLS